jgi:hypothetical protein
MSQIPTIEALRKEKDYKQTSREEMFKIVLNKCVEKVMYTNRFTDKTFVIFEVPRILIGFPTYDMKMCILFLKTVLSQHGYIVEFIDPFYLYIDWGTNGTNGYTHAKRSHSDKIKSQTKKLLERFPNTSKVEFVYEDDFPTLSKRKKKR